MAIDESIMPSTAGDQKVIALCHRQHEWFAKALGQHSVSPESTIQVTVKLAKLEKKLMRSSRQKFLNGVLGYAAAFLLFATSALAQSDGLPSWNDGPAKQAIID